MVIAVFFYTIEPRNLNVLGRAEPQNYTLCCLTHAFFVAALMSTLISRPYAIHGVSGSSGNSVSVCKGPLDIFLLIYIPTYNGPSF